MPVFAVIRQTDPQGTLPGAVVREFETAHYDLGNGVWLVAGIGTAQEISNKLGITPPAENGGTGVVIEAASYYGRANPAIWTWIKDNWERRSNG